MIRASSAVVIRPKFALLRFVVGLPSKNQLNALNEVADRKGPRRCI
jgi:hypothetical protein